jgi:23S rRNA (cytidine1920-2'-O)/16S rRNA (cytidine1409-2'-O)-methyltransferase
MAKGEDLGAAAAVKPFVSRGGEKLAGALAASGLPVKGRLCLDVGASTGGFTDCLLRAGAAAVVAVDVGYGQLAWSLRNDSRVHVLERTNARYLQPEQLPFKPDLAVLDVSFISLAKVLPAVVACLAPQHDLLVLVKPQFEVGPGQVGKGGVVRQERLRRQAVIGVATAALELGEALCGVYPAAITGPKGNRETFLWLAKPAPPSAATDAEEASGLIERVEGI